MASGWNAESSFAPENKSSSRRTRRTRRPTKAAAHALGLGVHSSGSEQEGVMRLPHLDPVLASEAEELTAAPASIDNHAGRRSAANPSMRRA